MDVHGIERALEGNGERGLPELYRALEAALAGECARFIDERRLKSCVYRLRFETARGPRSVVAKRLRPNPARRNELVVARWLPAVGMGAAAPAMLASAAEPSGAWVWQVYEDLGDAALDPAEPDRARVAAAARIIAQLHSRFADHPLLAECRFHGEDFGIAYFTSNLRDAVRALEQLRPPQIAPTADQASLRDRLLERLSRLLEEQPARARAIAEWGGPETFLHGDLWAQNVFVVATPEGPRARLIDWDRAGVGPASYDLSTFLLRFPPAHRRWVLELYRSALEAGAWLPNGSRELNLLFDTAECARCATHVIWPALAMLHDGAAWGFEQLAQVEGWFAALEPVLPEEAGR